MYPKSGGRYASPVKQIHSSGPGPPLFVPNLANSNFPKGANFSGPGQGGMAQGNAVVPQSPSRNQPSSAQHRPRGGHSGYMPNQRSPYRYNGAQQQQQQAYNNNNNRGNNNGSGSNSNNNNSNNNRNRNDGHHHHHHHNTGSTPSQPQSQSQAQRPPMGRPPQPRSLASSLAHANDKHDDHSFDHHVEGESKGWSDDGNWNQGSGDEYKQPPHTFGTGEFSFHGARSSSSWTARSNATLPPHATSSSHVSATTTTTTTATNRNNSTTTTTNNASHVHAASLWELDDGDVLFSSTTTTAQSHSHSHSHTPSHLHTPQRHSHSRFNSYGSSTLGLTDGEDDEVGGGGKDFVAATDEAEMEGDIRVSMLSLLYDPPVDGCDLRPYAAITDSKNKTMAVRVKHTQRVRFRWMRGDKRACSAPGCSNGATLQCLSCLKANLPSSSSALFCSATCFQNAWPMHRHMHAVHRIQPPPSLLSPGLDCVQWKEDNTDDDVIPSSPVASPTSALPPAFSATPSPSPSPSASPNPESKADGFDSTKRVNPSPASSPSPSSPYASESLFSKFPPQLINHWQEVSTERSYTPCSDDVGRGLRLECAPVNKRPDGSLASDSENWTTLETGTVIPAPPPPPSRQHLFKLTPPSSTLSNVSGFKCVCFNVLAQIYATRQIYPYTPLWALAWSYRKRLILREVLSHDADFICLQEVQANHFDKFFQPNLSKAGYEGVFKRKTREAIGDHPNAIDGCAIFFKRDRWTLCEQYGIEFDEFARATISDRRTLRRVLKGNIGLALVLEEVPGAHPQPKHRHRKPRRLCLVNTHMYWDPQYADVKLWQTWILCQELEKLVLHRNLPLVLCGDFNSTPDSTVYELLAEHMLSRPRASQNDPYKILPQNHMLQHRLPLVSSFASHGEPKFTNYTGHFVGCIDYIFYTKTHLNVTSCLDVDPESELKQHTALPSPAYPSDHIPLVTEFDWVDRD